jgi:putative membrane protein
MGFGFVVARFGLFLERLQMLEHTAGAQRHGLSVWFGTVLMGAGVVVNVMAGMRHRRLVRELDSGATSHSHPSGPAIAVAFFLALVGLGMAVYLVSVR